MIGPHAQGWRVMGGLRKATLTPGWRRGTRYSAAGTPVSTRANTPQMSWSSSPWQAPPRSSAPPKKDKVSMSEEASSCISVRAAACWDLQGGSRLMAGWCWCILTGGLRLRSHLRACLVTSTCRRHNIAREVVACGAAYLAAAPGGWRARLPVLACGRTTGKHAAADAAWSVERGA